MYNFFEYYTRLVSGQTDAFSIIPDHKCPNTSFSFPVQMTYFSLKKTTAIKIQNTVRSSRSQMFCKIGVFKSFANFTRKQPCLSLFLTKLQSLFTLMAPLEWEVFTNIKKQKQLSC